MSAAGTTTAREVETPHAMAERDTARRPMRCGPATVLMAALALAGCEPPPGELPPLEPVAQAVSWLGDTLYPTALSDSVRMDREAKLEAAYAAYRRTPADADSVIWLGRRLAYLGQYQRAIEVYTEGIADHPQDARLYRHRGHRYLTTRRLDRAIADLIEAARLVAGRPDEIEPDGLPNARGIPTSTLQFNIWYHLGLAHYLRADYLRAMSAYQQCLEVSANPDALVATSHWLYMTLRRLNAPAEAAAVLERITPDLDVIESHSYHRLLLMYRGVHHPDSLLAEASAADGLENATLGYGIANWYFYNGDADRALDLFERILRGPEWAAFGYVAAEAEIARVRAQR